MIEPLFFDAMHWFFMNNSVVLFSTGVITCVVLLVAMLSVLRKWGENY